MKNNASVSLTDMRYYHVYSAIETIDLFGDDYLPEYGISLPNDLIERIEKNREEFSRLQRELRSLMKDSEL